MIGDTVGDFRIDEKLGEGGFGVVYLATDTVLGRKVAVKTLDPVLTRDPKFRERFFDEARTQAQLQHPNIVTVFRFLEHEGQYYIVMEYLAGITQPDGTRQKTLADLIRQGPVPQERLIPLFHQLLDAVGYAHGHGVLHRDLKPLNVLFTDLGHHKVADFGIAKILSGESSISVSGHRVGTPAYMSPEQVLDKKLTRASDIYSLGCVLYELAVGRLPFKESDTSSLFEAHLQEPPVPPRQVNAQVSERLEQVILKAMEKKPQDRFRSCEEFAAALNEADVLLRPQPAVIKVPSLVGKSRDVAEELVTCLGLRFDLAEGDYSDKVPAGGVLTQQPAPGSETTPGQVVLVRLSRGSKPVFPDSSRTRPELTIPELGPPAPFSQPESRPTRPRRKTGWVVAGIVAGIAAVVLIAVFAGRKRPAVNGEGQPTAISPQPTAPSHTVPSGVTFLRTNAQGYEEILWLKDSSVMVRVPAGVFTMGSNDGGDDEKPVHQVSLDEYYIDKYEVTNRQYKRFCDATGRSRPPGPGFSGMSNYFTSYLDYPVVNVSWDDAVAYCTWAGKRLPTEAEWEKAARGTDSRKYPWGNSEPTGRTCNFADKNTDFSWSDKSWNDGHAYTAPVGNYQDGASPYGCMDMAGNVWEWCSDWYDQAYYGTSPNSNPAGPSSGSSRVDRGGSWLNYAGRMRCANRDWRGPSCRYNGLGFRCAGGR